MQYSFPFLPSSHGIPRDLRMAGPLMAPDEVAKARNFIAHYALDDMETRVLTRAGMG